MSGAVALLFALTACAGSALQKAQLLVDQTKTLDGRAKAQGGCNRTMSPENAAIYAEIIQVPLS